MSNTVISSIAKNISAKPPLNQGKTAKMLQHYHNLLYDCIAIYQKISKFLKISFQNLDSPPGRVYIVYMLQHCNY
jgi:hypothetical protein